MPAKRSMTLALALLLVAAIPARGATPPVLQQIDLRPGAVSSGPSDLISFKERVYFSADEGSRGSELWRSDGAPDASHTGTEILCDIRSGTELGSSPSRLTVLGDWLYFTADAGIARYRLYRTNGAVDSCQLVTDVGDYGFAQLHAVGDQLWFGGLSLDDGVEPAMTIAAGTPATVFDINPGGSSYPAGFTKLGSYVYFSADNGTDGYELWKSNGSGATMVANINDTAGQGSDPNSLLAVGNTIYFSAYDQSGGRELMHATAAGYTGYFDISAGLDSSTPSNLTDVNGQLYFTAFTPDAGTELWRVNSSGTAVERVADINPGAGSSTPYSLTPIGDWLYFTANDGASGWELWRTNGTTTELVKDISTGAGDSYPFGFTERNGVIFFQAYSGSVWTIFQTTGTEASTVEAVTSTGTNPYIGCECTSPVVFAGNRAFSYMGNNEFGWEVAFFDLSLPGTNRDGSAWSTALVLIAAVTAAAGVGLRMRGARRG